MDTDERNEASRVFAEAFCAGDLDRLEALLAPDFQFHGPWFAFTSREAYMQSLRDDPPEPGKCTILQLHGSGAEGAVLYEIERAGGRLLVAQFNTLRDGLIARSRLVFDTAALRKEGP